MATFKTDLYQLGNYRSAITKYRVISYFDTCSLIAPEPVTRGTRQMRIHFASIGHPIMSDSVYGMPSPLISRQALHAHQIFFIFDEQQYHFTAPIPADLQQAIDSVTASCPSSSLAI